ncbi:hypothetical protein LINGRAHAP2_LOCUS23747 [Linum grandiflorum]
MIRPQLRSSTPPSLANGHSIEPESLSSLPLFSSSTSPSSPSSATNSNPTAMSMSGKRKKARGV